MAYTHTLFSDLKTALSLRLDDSSKVFWTDTELGILLKESLRAFGLASAFWRERGTFSTAANTAFYDICTLLTSTTPETILAYSVTDRDIIQQLQYALLESAASQSAWLGTSMFTYSDIVRAVQTRLNQFLSDTGIVVTRSTPAITANATGRTDLSDSVIDIRRLAWLGAAPLAYYAPLWRTDEPEFTAADQTWSATAATPQAYSVLSPPPITLQLLPIPVASGTVELLSVNSGAALNPASSATILGIPDDLTPAIKWGALSDLLGRDGPSQDTTRAQYAEEMYQNYVQLARMLPVVISSFISSTPLLPCTLQELETFNPNWENVTGTPTDIVLAAPNLVALSVVPSSVLTVTLDVVRKTPMPASDAAYVQVGREQIAMILDYAEHLALFKCGGANFHATEKQAKSFLIQCVTYNQRLSAMSRTALIESLNSTKEKSATARRRLDAPALGALKGQA